jgi:hypothetical protein
MAAGLGFKTFTTGEVLTSADTNGYLMQGVLVFASAAARDAAITSPQEGQCCYLKDTDAVLTYSGSAWVGFDDSNAIQNTIVDAKGDLIGATAADTPARLAVGTNGQVLTADSTAATGLAWATSSSGSTNMAGKNGVLNSNMSVWQRGTTFNPTSVSYSADRWTCTRAVTGSTITRQTTSDTTNLPFIQYCARISRDSGNAATNSIYFGQYFENVNSTPFINQTVTVSFYARKGANLSGTLNFYLASGTGTDQNGITGTWTGNTYVVNQALTLTTTWTRYSYTGTVAAAKTQLGMLFDFGPTGTAGAADYFEVTGFQLEIASSASAYSPNAATFQGELAACQRYYYRITPSVTNGAFSVGNNYSTTINTSVIYPKVTLRTTPTLETSGTASNYKINTAGTAVTCSSVPVIDQTSTDIIALNSTVASGLTAGNAGILAANSGTTSILAFSAEL